MFGLPHKCSEIIFDRTNVRQIRAQSSRTEKKEGFRPLLNNSTLCKILTF